jgi:nitrate reductase assembly molybdenum cofactor insertion protein NarJ
MKDLTHYTLLAEMFRYPSDDMKDYPEKWNEILSRYDDSLRPPLDRFTAHIREKPLSFQQEYYISTFDVQAMCFLDIGYVLYGEDYRRGIFLVNIKKEQIKAKNDCGSELPDHLPNILTLLPKIAEPDLAEELIYSMLIPAINRMVLEFRDISNLYKGLLEVLAGIMEADFPCSDFERFTFNVKKSTEKAGSTEKADSAGKAGSAEKTGFTENPGNPENRQAECMKPESVNYNIKTGWK